jgi:hypothetical protein
VILRYYQIENNLSSIIHFYRNKIEPIFAAAELNLLLPSLLAALVPAASSLAFGWTVRAAGESG